MVNLTYEELRETKAPTLPPASLETLKQMRDNFCSVGAGAANASDFKLQPTQRFLRRILSPESPVRNLLMVHGTGQGKTCTAIQIAEEYIIRPEFQDKKVLILASPTVQENFRHQIFDISRVGLDEAGNLFSKQCTGRRYLDMIMRAQYEPLRLSDKTSQLKIMNIASKIISEFYEFQGYGEFANTLERMKLSKTPNEVTKWIHDNFDNRMIIIDEAHNIRETTETTASKLVAIAIENIVKVATNITLVLLTATPTFDRYDEILYYFNLFLWNDRKLDNKKLIASSEVFRENGEFRNPEEESRFRGWCSDYISFVKGDSPFTFPFRLAPTGEDVAPLDRKIDIYGEKITTPRKFLTLTQSIVSEFQEKGIRKLGVKATSDPHLICMYPENGNFASTFNKVEGKYAYKEGVDKEFLTPAGIAKYSSKFALITGILKNSEGVVFVYSNLVESGAQLFAMCLEEHGYESAIGQQLLAETSGEVPRGSKGRYVLFTANTSDSDIKKSLVRLRSRENVDGKDIRVIIASPKVSEGVDFRFVRQIHVLDPWFNMSRIEQIIGRGMRTCSHSLLPFEKQNCTIYLHICRYPPSVSAGADVETLDEYIYRVFVEDKAVKIANIKRIITESAIDCPLNESINGLPADWLSLKIPQTQSQDGKLLTLTLAEMSAPLFSTDMPHITCKTVPSVEDPMHVRPLSAVLDIRDEVIDKLRTLILVKPIWKKHDLETHQLMKQYSREVLEYLLQYVIDSRIQFKDSHGRNGFIESKKDVFSFAVDTRDTMADRILPIKDFNGTHAKLETHTIASVDTSSQLATFDINVKRESHNWSAYIKDRFENDVKDWYIYDYVLNEEEKLEVLFSTDWTKPPPYLADLRVIVANAGADAGVALFVLGSGKIYNSDKKLITPIGEQGVAYRKWISDLKDRYIDTRDDFFATAKEGVIVFNLDEKAAELRRADRTKTIGGRACTSFKENTLNQFINWLQGDDFPTEVKKKADRCMYLDLAIREAVYAEKEGLIWWASEVWTIFNEDEHRKELLKRMKE